MFFDTLNMDFFVRLVNIFVINLILSGDNAIVIGLAAASLSNKRQRIWALIIGGGAAIILRVVLTGIATWLMLIPFLSAVGGLLLIWVTYRLLKLDVEEEDNEKKTKGSGGFKQQVILILTADLMMSLDNVLAVAGAAHGDFELLIVGLIISMPIIVAGGGALSVLIDRFKWLIWVGAFAISYTAAQMIFGDSYIHARFTPPSIVATIVSLLIGVLVPFIFIMWNRRKANKQEAETESK